MAKRYRRERYLEKVKPFVDDTGLIKVVTGIRRCGKSCLMETVAEELRERGVDEGRIVYLDLERRGLRSVRTPDQLEAAIESRLPEDSGGITYLFVDEAQRVEGYEEVVNAYRADGSFSVFITGSNSYLLSGELMTNLTGIADYLRSTQGVAIKRETLASYIDLLVAAKVLYRCPRFDVRSRRSLQGGEKYCLADTGVYFARNVDATLNYGPLLENVTYTYLRSRGYDVSAGSVGKLELDFIARRPGDSYAYVQVSMSVVDPGVEEREYRPFRSVRDSWPCYLLTLDPLPEGKDGVRHLNLMEMMARGDDLG